MQSRSKLFSTFNSGKNLTFNIGKVNTMTALQTRNCACVKLCSDNSFLIIHGANNFKIRKSNKRIMPQKYCDIT